MNVLSLFDGMSCGMIALDRLGIKVDNYYASEIDKYAMQVSAANYPEIIQVGDITKLDLSTLPKIDLVMGGSPCQGFSFAGKQLAFDDPRSALFFEFVKCVKELNPKYFLLENVKMKKEYLDIISEYMGVEPIFIQSSLVSAQSRQRYYWTNIPGIEQPEERGIVLRDILEDQVGSEHYVGDNMQKNYKGGNQLNPNYKSQANTIHNEDKKSGTICAGTHGYANGYVGDKHKPVKHTERNARHLKQLDDKSLCMTATMYKGAGNNGMTLVPQRLVDDTSDLPEKSQTIKSQYYKSSKANFEREGTFHATGIPQKLVSDKPQHKELDHLKQFKIKDETVPKYVPNEEGDFCDPYNKKMIKGDKSTTLRTNSSNGNTWVKQTSDKPQHIGTAVDINGHDILKRVYSPDGKSPTVTACSGGNNEPKVVAGAWRGRYNEDGSTSQKLELTRDSKANAITTVQKDSVVTFSDKRIEKFKETLKENPQPSKNGIIQLNNPSHSSGRVYSPDGKSPTLMAGNSGGGKEPVKINDDMYWRKLTPLECERLQTVPDNYTNHVSNTQRYKMLGNGWTIEVIAHIFKNMEVTQ
jgi:DNA-cytosine methyltransferase